MRVRWTVFDGYAGKHRPQYTTIPDSELEGLSLEERDQLINSYIQEDFDNHITWGIDEVEL